MEELIKNLNNSLAGYVFDHAETGTTRGTLKLVFHEPISPSEKGRRPINYIAVTIKDVNATDVTVEKITV
jgi:hypothetical protein